MHFYLDNNFGCNLFRFITLKAKPNRQNEAINRNEGASLWSDALETAKNGQLNIVEELKRAVMESRESDGIITPGSFKALINALSAINTNTELYNGIDFEQYDNKNMAKVFAKIFSKETYSKVSFLYALDDFLALSNLQQEIEQYIIGASELDQNSLEAFIHEHPAAQKLVEYGVSHVRVISTTDKDGNKNAQVLFPGLNKRDRRIYRRHYRKNPAHADQTFEKFDGKKCEKFSAANIDFVIPKDFSSTPDGRILCQNINQAIDTLPMALQGFMQRHAPVYLDDRQPTINKKGQYSYAAFRPWQGQPEALAIPFIFQDGQDNLKLLEEYLWQIYKTEQKNEADLQKSNADYSKLFEDNLKTAPKKLKEKLAANETGLGDVAEVNENFLGYAYDRDARNELNENMRNFGKTCDTYKNGRLWIDCEDVSEFWREVYLAKGITSYNMVSEGYDANDQPTGHASNIALFQNAQDSDKIDILITGTEGTWLNGKPFKPGQSVPKSICSTKNLEQGIKDSYAHITNTLTPNISSNSLEVCQYDENPNNTKHMTRPTIKLDQIKIHKEAVGSFFHDIG